MKVFLIVLLLTALALPVSAATIETGFFIDGKSNVRKGPGSDYPVLFQPKDHSRFTVLARKGKWLKVELETGNVVWTHQQNIELDPIADKTRKPTKIFLPGYEKALTIHQKWYKNEDDGACYKLVIDDGKSIVWQDEAGKFPILVGDFGVEEIAATGDIDNDGRVEMLLSNAQSDVSPASFRMLVWNNGFSLKKHGCLIRDTVDKNRFNWIENPTGMYLDWIMYFKKVKKPGNLLVEVWRYQESGLLTGQYEVTAEGEGFRIVREITPMKAFE